MDGFSKGHIDPYGYTRIRLQGGPLYTLVVEYTPTTTGNRKGDPLIGKSLEEKMKRIIINMSLP